MTDNAGAFAFLFSFLFLCLLYRLRLYASLSQGLHVTERPEHAVLALSVWRGWYSDLLCGVVVSGIWLYISKLSKRTSRSNEPAGPLFNLLCGFMTVAVVGAMAAEVYLVTEQWNVLLVALPAGAMTFDVYRARSLGWHNRFSVFLLNLLLSSTVSIAALAGVIWSAGEIWRGKMVYHVWLPMRYVLVLWLVYGAWRMVAWVRVRLALTPQAGARAHGWAGMIVGAVLIFACALGMFAHYHVWLELESGLRWSLVGSSWGQFGLADFARFIPTGSYFFLVVPVIAFVMLKVWPGWLRPHAGRGLMLLAVAAVTSLAVFWNCPVKAETTLNPLHYLALDLADESLRWLHSDSKYAARNDLPGQDQMRSLKPVDPAFRSETALLPELIRPTASSKWNIVLLVLESTGAEYAFDDTAAGEPPMPFLRHLCENGTWLQNHHAPANSSSEAYFSIFTGIYPCPGDWNGTTTDNHAPALNQLLGSRYHSFLVHPSSRTYAFPYSLLENNGFRELFDRREIPRGTEPDKDVAARNETQAVGFFLNKIDESQQPFLAVYASFVPHYPYPDYGPDYRLFRHPKTERQYYCNNLRLLDSQLRRIHDHLASKGLLENTIIVVTGDHGEAFGQHPGVWKHCFATYDETFRTPALFYQPKLFPAKAVHKPTSHVDFVPTLLDAAGVAFNEKLFQGESLFRASDRKYLFTLTRNDGYYTALGLDGIKLSICFKSDASFAYDLEKDPRETVKLPAERFPAQLEALLKFRNYQLSIFPAYNTSMRMKRAFHGEAHPGSAAAMANSR